MCRVSDLADRYGRPRSRIPIVALATVLALLFGSWVVWAAWTRAHPAVAGQVRSFTVRSDREVDVLLRVDRGDPSVRASCTVIAQAVNFERVGQLTVDVPPGTSRLTDFPLTVRTLRRATSASLDHCIAAR